MLECSTHYEASRRSKNNNNNSSSSNKELPAKQQEHQQQCVVVIVVSGNERTYECRLLTALSPLKSIKQIIAAATANNSQPTNSQQLPNEASRTKRDYLLCYITHNTHSVLSTPSTPFTRSLTQSLNSTTTTSKDDVSLFKYAQPSKSTRYNNDMKSRSKIDSEECMYILYSEEVSDDNSTLLHVILNICLQ